MNKQIDTLLHKEMTRKEFLATLGLGVASIMGFSTIIHFLSGKGAAHSVGTGYGASVYGGNKER